MAVIDGAKYSLEEDGLRIHYIEPSDSGMYECRAEVVSQGNLKVQTILVDVLCKYTNMLTNVGYMFETVKHSLFTEVRVIISS